MKEEILMFEVKEYQLNNSLHVGQYHHVLIPTYQLNGDQYYYYQDLKSGLLKKYTINLMDINNSFFDYIKSAEMLLHFGRFFVI